MYLKDLDDVLLLQFYRFYVLQIVCFIDFMFYRFYVLQILCLQILCLQILCFIDFMLQILCYRFQVLQILCVNLMKTFLVDAAITTKWCEKPLFQLATFFVNASRKLWLFQNQAREDHGQERLEIGTGFSTGTKFMAKYGVGAKARSKDRLGLV